MIVQDVCGTIGCVGVEVGIYDVFVYSNTNKYVGLQSFMSAEVKTETVWAALLHIPMWDLLVTQRFGVPNEG